MNWQKRRIAGNGLSEIVLRADHIPTSQHIVGSQI
jgi:hypothetical protein